jgi:exopolysaccharide biosynthesis polyprenyl glycosylphosphotransferase
MAIQSKKEAIILFLGDVLFLYLSLFTMLLISYLGFPEEAHLDEHIIAFSIIFIIWITIFFIAGLYEKHTILFKNRLPNIILNTQVINTFIAVLFFYLIPYFAITPKTNLFIYLILSFGLILIWRIYGSAFIGDKVKGAALIINSEEETRDLVEEVNNNSRYSFYFASIISPDKSVKQLSKEILNEVKEKNISYIIINLKSERIKKILQDLYKLIYEGVEFIDKYKVYEDIFDRVPVSLLGYDWFLENLSLSPKVSYDLVKRMMDVIISLPLALLSLIFYPFVFLAIKMDDGGEIFIRQSRIGQDNKHVEIIKFRSMSGLDEGEEVLKSRRVVTKVGTFLRKSRIDELPQLWNVLKGDISLIGPRPEIPALALKYEEEIPYYNVRHLIKPGLSGWAQIYHDNHPHHGTDFSETKMKLSYDLYYIKNRSFFLDLKIALKTIKALLSRTGV